MPLRKNVINACPWKMQKHKRAKQKVKFSMLLILSVSEHISHWLHLDFILTWSSLLQVIIKPQVLYSQALKLGMWYWITPSNYIFYINELCIFSWHKTPNVSTLMMRSWGCQVEGLPQSLWFRQLSSPYKMIETLSWSWWGIFGHFVISCAVQTQLNF